MNSRKLASQTSVVLLFSVLLAACQSAEEPAPVATSSPVEAPITKTYEWYLERITPGGKTTIVRTADDRITNESFLHWNNREYTLNAELQLDENGLVVVQKITGTQAFGADIDETFSWEGGVATWRTPGEGGSVTAGQPAFYLPLEFGALGSMGALVRAATKNMNGELALFPSGTARVEKLREAQVESPDGPVNLSLYAVFGVSFTPSYFWFDQEMELTVVINGWMGMVPEGWSTEVLDQLTQVQLEEDTRLIGDLTGDLAYQPGGAVLFENVAVADVEAGVLLDGYDVLVENGKISAVSSISLDSVDALRIDGSGKTLIPGLWDMHGHLGMSDGILNIAGGITSVRDVGNEHEQIMALTEKIDSGAIIGPNVYRSGFMDRAGPFASGWAAESLEEALERVDFFADHGYMQIKLYSSIEPGWVAPIAERTHARGMRLSGHIPAFMSAEQAVRAGYDEIQHINMVFLNFSAGDREDTRKQLRFTMYGNEARNLDLDSPEVKDFFTLLKENSVTIDPTAAIFESMLTHESGQPDPTVAAVIDHLPPSVARTRFDPSMISQEGWAESAKAQANMLKALYESGIQLVPGTDDMAAFTLHRELEVYTEAGIPAQAVLRMATIDSARLVGVADRTGSIRIGKDSDLVLIEGNPFKNISAVRRATLVMKGDTLFRPDRLYPSIGVKAFLPSENF
jgi:imidazolonepropionase-like amidohydrolase